MYKAVATTHITCAQSARLYTGNFIYNAPVGNTRFFHTPLLRFFHTTFHVVWRKITDYKPIYTHLTHHLLLKLQLY